MLISKLSSMRGYLLDAIKMHNKTMVVAYRKSVKIDPARIRVKIIGLPYHSLKVP